MIPSRSPRPSRCGRSRVRSIAHRGAQQSIRFGSVSARDAVPDDAVLAHADAGHLLRGRVARTRSINPPDVQIAAVAEHAAVCEVQVFEATAVSTIAIGTEAVVEAILGIARREVAVDVRRFLLLRAGPMFRGL